MQVDDAPGLAISEFLMEKYCEGRTKVIVVIFVRCFSCSLKISGEQQQFKRGRFPVCSPLVESQ